MTSTSPERTYPRKETASNLNDVSSSVKYVTDYQLIVSFVNRSVVEKMITYVTDYHLIVSFVNRSFVNMLPINVLHGKQGSTHFLDLCLDDSPYEFQGLLYRS